MSAESSELRRLVERLVVELGTAFHQRAVYPTGHPQVRRSLERAFQAHVAWLEAAGVDEVSILVVDDQLVVEREPLPEDALWRRGLMQAMAKHAIGGLTLRTGLTLDELGAFLDSCFADGGAQASRHIHHGKARQREGGVSEALTASELGLEDRSGEAQGGGGEFDASTVAEAGEEWLAVVSGGTTRLERLRALVSRLARSAATAGADARALSAAGVADRALRHGLETALGSLRLGRALGVSNDVLEELGLAGLLHDIGYLDPSAAGETFEERRRHHPIRGALRLAAMEGLPESVVLAAYEHHLRWDTGENYPRLSAPRRPAAPARVVAVADSWSTLRSQADVTAAEAAVLLRGRSSGFLDPELVERFLDGLAGD